MTINELIEAPNSFEFEYLHQKQWTCNSAEYRRIIDDTKSEKKYAEIDF